MKIASILILALIALETFAFRAFPFESTFLSPVVSDFEIRKGEEYQAGPTAFGRLKGSEELIELGYLRAYPNFDDGSVFAIDMIFVEEYARGLGVAHAMFEFALKNHEAFYERKVTKISASSYVDGNLAPFLAVMISRLRKKPGYITPDKSKSYIEQFKECCSAIYQDYPEVQMNALKWVPAMRMGKDFGFGLCEESFVFEVSQEASESKDIYLNFDMCRE